MLDVGDVAADVASTRIAVNSNGTACVVVAVGENGVVLDIHAGKAKIADPPIVVDDARGSGKVNIATPFDDAVTVVGTVATVAPIDPNGGAGAAVDVAVPAVDPVG